jgi:AI-2 transport protein TqsA
MSVAQPPPSSARPAEADPDGAGWNTDTLNAIALCLIIGAASWYLLEQLTAFLRPLALAVFLSYLILPLYHRLRRKLPGPASYIVIVVGTLTVLGLLGLMIQISAADLREQLPDLFAKGQKYAKDVEAFLSQHASWLVESSGDSISAESPVVSRLKEASRTAIGKVADSVTEIALAVVYLLFFLLESNRFPTRVRSAFPEERAERILAVMDRINDSIARYIAVKVKASLLLAVPVTLILWMFGVKFPFLWGIVTFFCNFIPYLGSVIACTLPLALSFLQLDLGWAITVAVLVISTHMLSAYLVEPTITGRAVGLSPLIILAALTFWGLCWGPIGMLLAVPLTAIVRIVLENVEFTRPFARLLGEE